MSTNPLIYKTYYDLAKIVIWADNPNAADGPKRARMVFGFRDGNPRIMVYTGETGGVIAFPTDPLFFGGFLETLRAIATGPAGTKETMDSLTTYYEDNKPTNETRLISTLHIGKSKDGIIYLSVIAEGKAKLAFSLKSSKFQQFRGENKELLPDAIVSERMAIGLINHLYVVMGNCFAQYTAEEYTHGPRSPAAIKGQGGEPVKPAGKAKDAIFDDLDTLEL